MHNLCYGNEFDLHDNKRAGKTNFHNKGCAPGLVLKQRQKAPPKWPVIIIIDTVQNMQRETMCSAENPSSWYPSLSVDLPKFEKHKVDQLLKFSFSNKKPMPNEIPENFK